MTSLPADSDYAYLLELRTGLRRFLRWSEERAKAAGLTASQHQLLLAIRGHRGSEGPAINEIAENLLLRHHSAVELVDRAQAGGLVRRCADPDPDRYRVVRLTLTPKGADMLQRLAAQHLDELAHLAPAMEALWSVLEQAGGDRVRHPAARTTPSTGHEGEHRPFAVAPSQAAGDERG
ncbi:MAG: MarR family winged helix-turn-helix transcriptional regulator [Solirubrobacteraceae bacterium]